MLHTVAKVAPEALDDQLLLGLLAFGVDGDIYSRIGYMVDPVAHASAQMCRLSQPMSWLVVSHLVPTKNSNSLHGMRGFTITVTRQSMH